MAVPGGARARTIEQLALALAKASAVQQVLRLAVEELEHCDDHTAGNVVVFATNFTVRQCLETVHNLTGMP